MSATAKEKPALLVIDMVRDNFDAGRKLPITPLARETIAPLNRLSGLFRRRSWPVGPRSPRRAGLAV